MKRNPKERVKQTLTNHKEWLTTTEISKKADVHYYKTKEVLNLFLEKGKVEREQEGKYAVRWRWKDEGRGQT